MEPTTRPFSAEVRQLLDLVIHSLYSQREVFLRELISNAADALDRARLLGLSRDDLLPAPERPAIHVRIDREAGTLTVSDDGVGLTAEEAAEHLGTIARSGTQAFLERIREQGQGGDTLIGQFGVGFYAALMVADRVEVRSRSALPDAEPILWSTDGTSGTWTLGPAVRDRRGTDVVLHLREDAREFLEPDRVREVIRRHSEYVGWPIFLDGTEVGGGQALWTRRPSEVEDDEYRAFYKNVSGDWEDPATWLHLQSDAPLQVQAVLYLPRRAPMDLNLPDGRRPVRLYSRRVLIDPQASFLLPDWLRFVRGVVDCADIPLNVSREMVQRTPEVERLGRMLTGRVLKKMEAWAQEDEEAWLAWFAEFGRVLKEGVHVDAERRDRIVPLLRYRTTTSDTPVSLDAVVERMPEDQEVIWYLTAPDLETALRSPHLEAFRARGIEVVLMTDPVDEFVVQSLDRWRDRALRSVARGALDELEADEEASVDDALTEFFKETLGDRVAGVRASRRLTDSPAVLVDEHGMGANLERILRTLRPELPASVRVLEIHPGHPQVRAAARLLAEGRREEAATVAHLLLDQARLAEGEVDDPAGLLRRIDALARQAYGGPGEE